MDSNARKQLKIISEAMKHQKKHPKNKVLIEQNTVISSEAKPGEKAGVYIKIDALISIIKKSTKTEIRIVEVTSQDSLAALIN